MPPAHARAASFTDSDRGVEHRLGPGGQCGLALGRAGGNTECAAAERLRDPDGGESDPASGSEHEHPLARTNSRALAQGEQARAVALRERRRPGRVEDVGDARHRTRSRHDTAGVAAEPGRYEYPLSHREPRHLGARLYDVPRRLCPGHEGHLGLDLVLAGDEQRVDVVHAGRLHLDHHPGRARVRVGALLDAQQRRGTELMTDDGAASDER